MVWRLVSLGLPWLAEESVQGWETKAGRDADSICPSGTFCLLAFPILPAEAPALVGILPGAPDNHSNGNLPFKVWGFALPGQVLDAPISPPGQGHHVGWQGRGRGRGQDQNLIGLRGRGISWAWTFQPHLHLPGRQRVPKKRAFPPHPRVTLLGWYPSFLTWKIQIWNFGTVLGCGYEGWCPGGGVLGHTALSTPSSGPGPCCLHASPHHNSHLRSTRPVVLVPLMLYCVTALESLQRASQPTKTVKISVLMAQSGTKSVSRPSGTGVFWPGFLLPKCKGLLPWGW